MKTLTNRVFLGLAAAMMLLLAGCGEKEKTCFFVSRDGRLLQEGACVIWKDACDEGVTSKAYVGRVGALEEAGQGVKVTIRFKPKHGDDLHDGVAARIVNDPKFSPKAFVLLTGGKDSLKPLIEDGAMIPEARESFLEKGISAFLNWIRNEHCNALIIYMSILIGLVVFIKVVGKMLKFVLFLAFVCVVCHVCLSAGSGWSGYKERQANAVAAFQDVKTWLVTHAEDLKQVLKTAVDN